MSKQLIEAWGDLIKGRNPKDLRSLLWSDSLPGEVTDIQLNRAAVCTSLKQERGGRREDRSYIHIAHLEIISLPISHSGTHQKHHIVLVTKDPGMDLKAKQCPFPPVG